MEKIKVLHLELDENLGGIESFLYNLYREIDKEKVQMDFVTRSHVPAKGMELEILGAHIYKVADYSNPFKYSKDLDNLIKRGYEIIHIHKNSAAVILPFIIAKKNRKLVVSHSHNTLPSRGKLSALLHKINRNALWKLSDKHLACSELAGKWMYGNNKEFQIVNNGILISRYLFSTETRKLIRKKLGLKDSDFVIGHVGRFTEQKNHRRLIDIFKLILNNCEDAKLLLCGEGKLKQVIQGYVIEKEITDKVLFLGNRNDISEIMMAMDVFMMPSTYEGLPIAAIEAQASGMDVFLADSISKQTEKSSGVKWFSLKQTDEEIADQVILRHLGECVRKTRNIEVKASGFDITWVAKYISELYENMMKR